MAVTPNYYDTQDERINYRFDLTGLGFWNLPDDCIGIIARNNDFPLNYKDDTTGSYEVNLTERTQTTAIFEKEHAFAVRTYLGGIVSADRQTIYWQNNTRPLP